MEYIQVDCMCIDRYIIVVLKGMSLYYTTMALADRLAMVMAPPFRNFRYHFIKRKEKTYMHWSAT